MNVPNVPNNPNMPEDPKGHPKGPNKGSADPHILNGPALLDAIKQLQQNMQVRMEVFEHQSVILWAKYNLCLDKGFSSEQAVHLCTQNWSNAL